YQEDALDVTPFSESEPCAGVEATLEDDCVSAGKTNEDADETGDVMERHARDGDEGGSRRIGRRCECLHAASEDPVREGHGLRSAGGPAREQNDAVVLVRNLCASRRLTSTVEDLLAQRLRPSRFE